MKTCSECKIEFESKRIDAKYCSPKCRKDASRKATIVTDNVTLNDPIVTDKFEFTVKTTDHDAPDVQADKQKVRTAKYWYDVPLGAIPIIKKGWPEMDESMNGRQYFLWWKNEFQLQDDKNKPGFGLPQILNPYPKHDKLEYVNAGEGSRRWGA